MTVLCYLCDEIHEMKETAEEEFYRGIAVFGHVAGEEDDVTEWRNGKAELIMGRAMKFFQVSFTRTNKEMRPIVLEPNILSAHARRKSVTSWIMPMRCV